MLSDESNEVNAPSPPDDGPPADTPTAAAAPSNGAGEPGRTGTSTGAGDNGQPAQQAPEPSRNGTGNGTDNTEVSPWREVTAEDPCRVPGCGAPSGCKVDLKHHRAACLKVGGPLASDKTGADGLTYHVHALCDESLQVIEPIPSQLVQFINALFARGDWVSIRPIETWTEEQRKRSRVAYKHVVHMKTEYLTERASWWTRALHRAKVEKANLFFGVCPRFGDHYYDCAFQVRRVRVLWADLDHCTPEEALARCEKAKLPRPSVVVRSGHGTHLYWILAEPYLIDDAGGDPLPIYKEWVKFPDGRQLPRSFVTLPTGEKVYKYQTDPRTGGDSKTQSHEWPDGLSPKAKHIQTVVEGANAVIGGDHTHDLARLLRFPCTFNRKDERNGKPPVPCELIECDATRRYPLSDFEKFIESAPEVVQAKELAKVRLRQGVDLTAGRRNTLGTLLNACALADDRSKADWNLCCWAVRTGLDKEEVWREAQAVGKFEQRGRAYFDLTWGKAETEVRKQIYVKLTGQAPGATAASRRADHAPPPPGEAPQPDAGGRGTGAPVDGRAEAGQVDDQQLPGDAGAPNDGEEPSPDSEIHEAVDDPHRLAKLFYSDQLHLDGPTVHIWRDQFYRWDGAAYRLYPDKELRAALCKRIKAEFDEVNRRELEEHELTGGIGPDGKQVPPPDVRKVTTRLIADVVQAYASLVMLAGDVEPPCWKAGAGAFSGPPPFPAHEVLACKNQLVHLPSLVQGRDCLLSATPRLFTLNALDYDFDPAAARPARWLEFLHRLWPDDEQSIETLQDWFGYFLTPDTRFQKILMMVGPPRSGRGTIARILRQLVSEGNVCGPTLSSLGTNFGLWPLLGKTVAVISDARISGRTDQAVVIERLLSISGEDALTVDRKNLPPVTTRLRARVVIITNELPNLMDASGALANRMILLQMLRSWLGREDTTLTDQLLAELPGILLWAIEGWHRVHTRGHFVQPAAGAEILGHLKDMASPVAQFVHECCTVQARLDVPKEDLYHAWVGWCLTVGRRQTADSVFARDLYASCATVTSSQPREDGERVRRYTGIALNAKGTALMARGRPRDGTGSGTGSGVA
jgi:putative DNA primase/helicase